MGVKRTPNFVFNWQSTNPAPFSPNTPLSGVLTGAMASTNTVYSNIQDITNTDNQGLEITWTGTPTGTITILCSASGVNFYPLTFSPTLTQPAGSAGGYLVNLNQIPWRYVMIQYTNSTGTGSLTVWNSSKDLN
jgi:hypothetical protein